MNESFGPKSRIGEENLREFTARSDGPSLRRILLQWMAILATAAALLSTNSPAVWTGAGTVLLGALLASIFAPFHECLHGTAFRSRKLNHVVAGVNGILFGIGPTTFRAFHFAHHRHTHDPQLDPELIYLPRTSSFDSTRPGNRVIWVVLSSGVGLLYLKVIITGSLALLPRRWWTKRMEWLPPSRHRAAVFESRVIIAAWGGLTAISLLGVPSLVWIVISALLSHLYLGLWLTTEHTGLPDRGTIFDRTRTILASPFVRWWIWNMNYHTEHHAWPAVPWHRLPTLHETVNDDLAHRENGYPEAHYAALVNSRDEPGTT